MLFASGLNQYFVNCITILTLYECTASPSSIGQIMSGN